MTAVPEWVNAYVARTTGELVLLRRDASGKLLASRRPAEYSSFHRLADVAPEVRRWAESSPGTRSVLTDGEHLRVEWHDDRWRRWGLEADDSPLAKIPSFEGDVHPVRRYMIDSGARVQAPRRAYFDLEVDSRCSFAQMRAGEARVLCYALLDASGTVVSAEVLEDWSDGAERHLLEQFVEAAAAFDQLSGWNIDNFDKPVLVGGRAERSSEWTRGRFERLGIRLNEQAFLWLDHLAAFKRMNKATAESGELKTSFKLQSIATEIVGEGKNDFDASKTYEEWAAGGERRRRLLEYCVQDTRLLPLIEAKTGYLDALTSIADLTGVFPDSRGLLPSSQVDTFLLRLARERGIRFPTHRFGGRDEKQFRGAYREPPKWKGIARDVQVCDFAGQYPSTIVSCNISPETRVEDSWASPELTPEEVAEGRVCRAPGTGVRFRRDRIGILPEAILRIGEMRARYNKAKGAAPPGTPEWVEADRRQYSAKVVGLAFYGVITSAVSRFGNHELGESITQTAVLLIRHVAAEAEKLGWVVGYIDTDSIFVQGPSDDEFRAFVRRMNEVDFPRIMLAAGCERCTISLDYEKKFDRIVFVTSLRYVGRFAHYKGKVPLPTSKPEIKGIEYKRGDSLRTARQLQERIIRMLLGDWLPPHEGPVEDVERYRALLVEFREHVLRSPVLPPEDVVLSAALSQGLGDYKRAKRADGSDADGAPHVRVARILAERGEEVHPGSRIEYVMVDRGGEKPEPIPASDYVPGETPVDRYYLWENRVYPPAERLLVAAFPDVNWAVYECARPQKRAPLRGGAGPGQGALFADVAGSGAPVARLVAVVPAMRRARRAPDAEYLVEMTAAQSCGRMGALRALLERHPGPRPVVLAITTPTSAGPAVVRIDAKLRVAGSPELAVAVAALLLGAAFPVSGDRSPETKEE